MLSPEKTSQQLRWPRTSRETRPRRPSGTRTGAEGVQHRLAAPWGWVVASRSTGERSEALGGGCIRKDGDNTEPHGLSGCGPTMPGLPTGQHVTVWI